MTKVFGRIIHENLALASFNILIEEQHVFRKGMSTIRNLKMSTKFLIINVEAGTQVDAVYTDFPKTLSIKFNIPSL